MVSSRLHRANPYVIILITATLFLGCSARYHLRKAEKHLKLAESKGAQVRVDTIYKTISVAVPETHFDTVLTVQNFRDTIVISKNKIVTKIKFDTITRRLYVHTLQKADTVFVEVPVTVTKKIETGMPYWWLAVAAGIILLILLKRKKER